MINKDDVELAMEQMLAEHFGNLDPEQVEQVLSDLSYDELLCEEDASELQEALGGHVSARTYEEAGVLTTNRGVVVKFGGMEVQLTIVASKSRW